MAGALLLEANGCRLLVPEEDVILHTLALAAGEEDEATYAAWLREVCAE